MWLFHCVLGHCIKGDLSPLIWYIKVMSLYGVISYHVTISEGHIVDNHPIYGVINYHVTLSEGHMIANHPRKGNTCAPSCGNFDLFVTKLFILYKG